jgi:hypothetical protein
MLVYYYGIKFAFLFGLIKPYVSYDPLQKHWLFLALLYTAGVGFLYFALFQGETGIDWTSERKWLGGSFLSMCIYLKLLSKFEEGFLFWAILLLGLSWLMYW